MSTETEQEFLDFESTEPDVSEDFSSDIEQTEEEIETPPPKPYQEKKTIIDIDGHQMEVSETLLKKFYGLNDNDPMTEREWKTALSAYKTHKKADINTEKYRRNDKLMYDFVELLQNNPAELLKRAGHDPRKFSEKYITEIIEEELMPEEQRRTLALQRERDELERQLNEERTRQQQVQMDYLTEQHERDISTQIMQALDETTLPKTPDVVRRIGYYLMRSTQQNLNIPIKRIISLVKDDIYKMNQEISNNLTDEELMSFFGEEKIKKIRQLELQKIRKPQPFQSNGQQNNVPKKTKLDEKKSLTRDEFRELIKRRSRI
jgi:hypothetical protein